MGLLSGLMGNASEVDDSDLEKVLANTLITVSYTHLTLPTSDLV